MGFQDLRNSCKRVSLTDVLAILLDLADEENICFGGRHEVGKESDDDEDQKVDE